MDAAVEWCLCSLKARVYGRDWQVKMSISFSCPILECWLEVLLKDLVPGGCPGVFVGI
jgi:hypothetical protein